MFFHVNTYLSCYTESGLNSSSTCWLDCDNDEHVVISSSAFLPMNLPFTGRRPPSVWEAMSALSPTSVRDVAFLVSLIDDAIQVSIARRNIRWLFVCRQHRFVANMSCLIFVSFLELAEVRLYDKEVHNYKSTVRKQKQNNHSSSLNIVSSKSCLKLPLVNNRLTILLTPVWYHRIFNWRCMRRTMLPVFNMVAQVKVRLNLCCSKPWPPSQTMIFKPSLLYTMRLVASMVCDAFFLIDYLGRQFRLHLQSNQHHCRVWLL